MHLRCLLLSLTLLPAIGCTVDDLDLGGRQCPCVDGYACDEATNTCVAVSGGDGGTPEDGGGMEDPDGGPRTDAGGGDDAGAMDAGGSDGGPPDAGPGPTGCDDIHAGRAFCDGFESGDIGAWDGTRLSSSSTVDVVDAPAPVYRGDHALRAEATDGSRAQVWVDVFPLSGISDQWLRAYHYIPSDPGLPLEVNTMIATDLGDDMVVYLGPDATDIHGHGYAGSAENTSFLAPLDTWICIELHVHFDATDGYIELFIDGAPIADQRGIDTVAARGLQRMNAGVAWKDTDATSRVVYVDEVVADASRIPCD